MAPLKLGAIIDAKPVKVSVEIPADLHRDLTNYANALSQQTGQAITDPVKLIVPMLQRFIETDRAFVREKRNRSTRQ